MDEWIDDRWMNKLTFCMQAIRWVVKNECSDICRLTSSSSFLDADAQAIYRE